MLIFGIETSCDETAAAIIKDGREVIANVVATQIKTHEKFGGVIPEIAAREHLDAINVVIDETFEIAKKNVDLTKQNIYFAVQNAYINMIQLEKNIPLMKTKVKQTLENYELADARYEVGLGNFIELQDAKENYNNAQRDYVQTIYQYNVALVNLQTAMGER